MIRAMPERKLFFFKLTSSLILGDGDNIGGMSFFGSACDSMSGERMNINEKTPGPPRETMGATARTLAHEIGHNLGMW